MISVSCYPIAEVPLWNLFLSALYYPYRRPCHGGSASVLFCYPDPEVPLWNWLFVTPRVYVLFCYVLLKLMDVSRKLNHDLWFLSVHDLDKLWFWYELNYDFWICMNSFIETLYSIIIHWAFAHSLYYVCRWAGIWPGPEVTAFCFVFVSQLLCLPRKFRMKPNVMAVFFVVFMLVL